MAPAIRAYSHAPASFQPSTSRAGTRRQREEWVQREVEYIEDVIRQAADLPWTEVRKSKRGRQGYPARRFAIWLFLTRTASSHRQIADAVGATVEQVTLQIYRLRHGPMEPPLSTWIQRAGTWLRTTESGTG